ncbi:MAG: carbamate kinase [Gammaproteobacteria bacterium]|nr:carbamate kinase [Gammaproteobacteria bacterium]
MRIVVALGGNALLQPHQPLSAENLLANTQLAANALAPLTKVHELILCHGNGPQVGLLAVEDAQYQPGSPYPLDLLVAETQGMIGYPLQQAMQNSLPQQAIVTLLTQVLVDPDDPAFQQPTKPIGPYYDEKRAATLQSDYDWHMVKADNQMRRVVASPKPQEIIEIGAIRDLLKDGHLVICTGGGGIPVIREGQMLRGVEAVIDKDYTAACLAEQLAADVLLILTDVAAVYQYWGTAAQQAIHQASPQALSQLDFPAGSMAPKIGAACQFVNQKGGKAVIAALAQAEAALNGECGTTISPQIDSMTYE